MNQVPRISVIIPTLKREVVLLETLNSLQLIDYPADKWEVVVVDQTVEHEETTKNHLAQLEKQGKIRWFRPPEITFTSLTKARNFGLDKADRPEIIVFIDDDVEVMPDFLRHHARVFHDEMVGATVGKVIVPGHTYPQPPFQVGVISWWGDFVNNFHGETEVESHNFIGCNFSLRADLLAQLGKFDEEYIGNALREDSDMAVRINQIGKKIIYAPQAGIIHKQVATGGTRTEQRLLWYYGLFYNNMLFYGKHFPAWRIPFFSIHLGRPILACWLYYGRGSWQGLRQPVYGIRDGLAAASRSQKSGVAIATVPDQNRVV